VGKWKDFGILLIVFGVITLAVSGLIYNYQMSQDGDIIYKDGNWYELSANPQVVSLMGTGMLVGICCIVIGLVMLFVQEEKHTAQKIRPGSYYQQQAIESPSGLPVNYCPGCGRQVGPSATFCENCGRRLN